MLEIHYTKVKGNEFQGNVEKKSEVMIFYSCCGKWNFFPLPLQFSNSSNINRNVFYFIRNQVSDLVLKVF